MSFKKWLYKYKYLLYELEDIDGKLEVYMKEFNQYFVTTPPKEKPSSENNLQEENFKSEEISKKLKNSKKKNKEFYKKLSKKTHPDKGGDVEDFKDINSLYEDDDILGMYLKAEELGINLNEEEIEIDEKIFEQSCKVLEEKSNEKRKTLAWLWGSCPPQDRDNMIVFFKTNFNVEPRK